MRRFHPSFPFLVVFLIVPAIAVYLHSVGVLDRPSFSTSVLLASTESAEDLYRQGVDRFEEQRYEEAIGLFQAVMNLDGTQDSRALTFHREASALRLALTRGETAAMVAPRRALVQLAEDELDDWGVQAVIELVRAGFAPDADVSRLLTRAQSQLEQQADVESATGHYIALMRAMIRPERGQVVAVSLERMWENLVRVEAPREELLELGSFILAGRSYTEVPSPRRRHGRPVAGNVPGLLKRVAEDVLKLEPQAWLAASAQLKLGQIAEQEGKRGIAAGAYRAVLELERSENSQSVRVAQQALKNLTEPQGTVSGPLVYQPGSTHQVAVRWRNLSRWSLELRRLDPVDDVRIPKVDARDVASYYPRTAGDRLSAQDKTDQKEIDARANGTQEVHSSRAETITIDPLPVGLYSAVLTAEPFEGATLYDHIVFQVTDVGLLQTNVSHDGESDALEFWLVNMANGSVQSDVDLKVHLGARNQSRVNWTQSRVRTDDDGLARVPVRSDQFALVVGEVDGRPIVSPFRVRGRHRPSTGVESAGFVLTDRPLYRPGESVHVQAFLRDKDQATRTNRLPRRTEVEAVVSAPDGTEFYRQGFTLDGNGAVEFDLDLPLAPALGQYGVQIVSPGSHQHLAYGHFQVDEYRLPEFTVSVALDDDRRYVLGDDLEIEVVAEYLFGGAVSGEAEVVVRRSPHWVHYMPIVRYSFGAADHRMVPPYHYGGQDEVFRESMPLDEDGKISVVLPTESRAEDTSSYRYTVEVRVTDSSRREENGQASVLVTDQELYAFLHPTQYIVAPGNEAQVRLRVQDANGRPVVHAGSWNVSLREKDDKSREVLTRTTQTDEGGSALLKFQPQEPGYYTVKFSTQDDRGNEVTAETTVWCADPKTRSVVHAQGGLQLIAERDAFLTEDTARVLLVSEVAGASVYLMKATGKGVETEVLRTTGTVQLLEIELDRSHRPYFHLNATRASDYQLHQANVQVIAPLADQAVEVELNFAKDEAKPGEVVPLHVRTLDIEGNPVETPVTVTVVDGAVLAILPRNLVDPNQVFHNYYTWQPPQPSVHVARWGGYRFLKDEDEDEGRRDDFGDGAMRMDTEMAEADANSLRALGYATGARQMAKSMAPAPAAADESMAPVAVRTDFRTTALWRTAIQTDADGRATVDVPLAESLTNWEALVVSMSPETRCGTGTTEIRTRKPVMVRLNHPRVFREKDRFLFAATVHNETDEDLAAKVTLEARPLNVAGAAQTITVPAHGQAQVEWWANVPAESASLQHTRDDETERLQIIPDEAWVKVTAETRVDSDAFERTVKLLVHGTEQRLVAAGEVRPGTETMSIELPPDRVEDAQVATLTLSPSVLSACVDALPYLADYPYGCVEQTLSRFVPAVAVRHAIESLGGQSKRIDPDLDDKIASGLRRVLDAQNGDGGWGWWSEGNSQTYMTAYALVALQTAQDSGVDVPSQALRRGREWLRNNVSMLEGNADSMAYALFALSTAGQKDDETLRRYADRLLKDRDRLRDYARALLALHLHRVDRGTDAQTVLDHLQNTVEFDSEYKTAHWGKVRGYWWRGDGAVETTAFALAAYNTIDPTHRNHAAAARWLVMNREGNRWSNTRATAHTIYALVDYARHAGELDADYSLIALVNGKEVTRIQVQGRDLIDGGGAFPVPADLLRDGTNQVALTLDGRGVCYATLAVDTYTTQENPEPTKFYLGVERELIRLTPKKTLGGNILQIESPLQPGDAVTAGDRIRVRLKLTAHNDLEYVAIEDPRPAGCEPTDQLSGRFYFNSLFGRREVRDDRTAFFISRLSQGEHILEYELRAESPGEYHVMPTAAYSMYVPNVNGTSEEAPLQVAAPSSEASR